jgi:hypothetical protein
MVEFAESDAPSDGNLHGERGTMSAGRDKTAEPAEPMLKLHKDLPKAKPPLGRQRLTVCGHQQQTCGS